MNMLPTTRREGSQPSQVDKSLPGRDFPTELKVDGESREFTVQLHV